MNRMSRGVLAFALSLSALVQAASCWLRDGVLWMREPSQQASPVPIVHLVTAPAKRAAHIACTVLTALGFTLLGVDRTSASGFSTRGFAVPRLRVGAPSWLSSHGLTLLASG